MLAVASHPLVMSTLASTAAPKRPRLSLRTVVPAVLAEQCNFIPSEFRSSSPTVLNTLSNAYALAIEQYSPQLSTSYTTAPLSTTTNVKSTILRSSDFTRASKLTTGSGRITTPYPAAESDSCQTSSACRSEPESREEATAQGLFDNELEVQPTSSQSAMHVLPYTQPPTLKSILRNSPLSSTRSTKTVRIKNLRYNSPLTQTIATDDNIESPIDLTYNVHSSPSARLSPDCPQEKTYVEADILGSSQTRDGGWTPGPREEIRRREADSLIVDRERQRGGKKRRWVWTIGNEEEEAVKA